MNTFILLLIALVFLASFLFFLNTILKADVPDFKQLTTEEEPVKMQGKLDDGIFVVLYRAGCGWCDKFLSWYDENKKDIKANVILISPRSDSPGFEYEDSFNDISEENKAIIISTVNSLANSNNFGFPCFLYGDEISMGYDEQKLNSKLLNK